MPSESLWDYAVRMGKIILIIDAILFAGAGIICGVAGWRTWAQFGTALIYAGVGVLALGFAGLIGGSGRARVMGSHFAHTSPQQIDMRNRSLVDELRGGTSFTILMGAAAVLPLIVGAFLI